ncbi:baseplate wedge protein 53 [Methanohalobium sp.]|uniref:baseplate wedge protein 53 n=1 Tax=Methanohalobium sp. TaxID=2837493 RepID=UPI0025FB6209|nr:baseplate wedge protein 53 [Methanohalobium sp.]
MSNYFSAYFPQTLYVLGDGKKQATNITLRFIVRDIIKKRSFVYYSYSIQDGDRPDTIAAKYYGNSNYDWIIMIVNDIFDVNYDWPMDSYRFEKYLRDKYGSVAAAKSQVNRYEKIIKEGGQDEFGNPQKRKTVVIDKNTYDQTSLSKRLEISAYEYERDLNESKREISILDKFYLGQILEEAEDIFE